MAMNKFTLAGLVAWIVGGVIVGFQAIGNLMQEDTGVRADWKNIDLMGLIGEPNLQWAMEWNWLVYVLDQPLYIVLFALGLLLIVMGMVFWRN
jgi:hypothetical protein